MENTDPTWKWLDEHLKRLTATNANTVTSGIMSQIHLTGRTPSALIAQLLRTVYQLNLTVDKEKEEKMVMIEVQEREKNNLLELMFAINKNSAASTKTSTPSVELANGPSIESTTEPNIASSSIQSTETRLTVAASKIRDKSPKRVLQYIIINEPEQLEYSNPWYPLKKVYPNVEEFKAIFQKDVPFSGGYVCTNCNSVVVSSLEKNNQRTFSCHLSKCAAFIEKVNLGNKPSDSKENNVATEGSKDDGDAEGLNTSDGDAHDSNGNDGKSGAMNGASE